MEQKAKTLNALQRIALASRVAIRLARGNPLKGDPVFPRGEFGSLWSGPAFMGTLAQALSFSSYRGTTVDYQNEVGELTSSSLCMAVWQYMGTCLTEAAPMVKAYEKGDTKGEPVPDHPLVQLMKQPNPYCDGATLMQTFALDWLFSGDVYWIKVRDKKYLTPIQLWYVPYFMMQPMADETDKSVFIKEYQYIVDGYRYTYEPSEVVHTKRGQNPRDLRRGIGVFDSVLREIYTDNQASNFSAVILKNWGIVPYVLSPPKNGKGSDAVIKAFGDSPQEARDQAEQIKASFMEATTGDQRGAPIVNTIPLEITKLPFSPQELDISNLHKVPESRISGVTGLPAALLQFIVGLENGTSYASYKEAREQAYESVIKPLMDIIASAINRQLLPDFGDPQGRRLQFEYDFSKVAVLQEDVDKVFERADKGVAGGWLLVSDARSMAGLPSTEHDNIYLRGGVPVPFDEPMQVPEPPKPAVDDEEDAIDGEVVDDEEADKLGKKLMVKLLMKPQLNGHTKILNELLAKYNPDQPRDESGRWTAGGARQLTASLDQRLVDYKPDRSLSDPTKVTPIENVIEAHYEPYSQMPFLNEMHRAMGISDPSTVQIEEYVAKRDAFFKSLPLHEVPLDDIVVTQQNVNKDRVQEIREHPETTGGKNPYLVRFGGKTYVINGHHRLIGDVMSGKESISGHAWNLDETKGGAGSGYHGHAGRPGQIGGSAPSGTMTQQETELTNYLKMISGIKADPPVGFKYNGLEDLVYHEGQIFRNAPLPAGVKDAQLGLCYMNAYQLVEYNPDLNLDYVEGYAVSDKIGLPLAHAWAVTKEGKVIDPTWDRMRRKGEKISYYGVKIPMSTVRKTIFAREKYGVLFDPEQGFPLFRTGVKGAEKKGGAGSGHHGHAGRPGQIGGSVPESGVSLSVPTDSQTKYKTSSGSYKPERARLHRAIVNDILQGGVKSDVPTVFFLGGGPAAGKTTAIINRLRNQGTLDGVPTIDPDDIKSKLPEFKQLVADKDPNASNFVHEESSDISKIAIKESLGNGYNTLVDTTGDNDITKLETKLTNMRNQGAKRISAEYAFVTDIDLAIDRANKRGLETGRHVHPSFVRKVHQSIPNVFQEAVRRGLYDDAKLFNTDTDAPELVMTFDKKSGINVVNETLWKRFQELGQ